MCWISKPANVNGSICQKKYLADGLLSEEILSLHYYLRRRVVDSARKVRKSQLSAWHPKRGVQYITSYDAILFASFRIRELPRNIDAGGKDIPKPALLGHLCRCDRLSFFIIHARMLRASTVCSCRSIRLKLPSVRLPGITTKEVPNRSCFGNFPLTSTRRGL